MKLTEIDTECVNDDSPYSPVVEFIAAPFQGGMPWKFEIDDKDLQNSWRVKGLLSVDNGSNLSSKMEVASPTSPPAPRNDQAGREKP